MLEKINSKSGRWPWHGGFYWNDGKTNFFWYLCGVTILTNKFSVTAKYCVFNKKPANKQIKYYVMFEQYDINDYDAKDKRNDVVQVYDNSRLILIELEFPLVFTEYVQPICLWNTNVSSNEVIGETGYIVGYGGIVIVSVIPKSNCEITEDNFELLCANYNNSMPNGLDAGGGLVVNVNEKWFLRGVFSTDPAIVHGQHNVILLDIAYHLDWIESVLNK